KSGRSSFYNGREDNEILDCNKEIYPEGEIRSALGKHDRPTWISECFQKTDRRQYLDQGNCVGPATSEHDGHENGCSRSDADEQRAHDESQKFRYLEIPVPQGWKV